MIIKSYSLFKPPRKLRLEMPKPIYSSALLSIVKAVVYDLGNEESKTKCLFNNPGRRTGNRSRNCQNIGQRVKDKGRRNQLRNLKLLD